MPVANDDAVHGVTAEAPGGAYSVKLDTHTDNLVVSAPAGTTIHGGFAGLLVQPDQAGLDRMVPDLPAALSALAVWTDARLAGSLADARRQHIIREILASLYGHLCGAPWRQAERAYLSVAESDETLQALSRLVSADRAHRGFAPALRHNFDKTLEGVDPAVRWFSEVSTRYGVSTEPELCRFALRLASDPSSLPQAYPEQLTALTSAVAGNPMLLRGARLVALRAARTEDPDHPNPLPRWSW
jgi:hypothetical protein